MWRPDKEKEKEVSVAFWTLMLVSSNQFLCSRSVSDVVCFSCLLALSVGSFGAIFFASVTSSIFCGVWETPVAGDGAGAAGGF